MYIFGGLGKHDHVRDLTAFNIRQRRWEILGNYNGYFGPPARRDQQMVAVGKELVVLGGARALHLEPTQDFVAEGAYVLDTTQLRFQEVHVLMEGNQ